MEARQQWVFKRKGAALSEGVEGFEQAALAKVLEADEESELLLVQRVRFHSLTRISKCIEKRKET